MQNVHLFAQYLYSYEETAKFSNGQYKVVQEVSIAAKMRDIEWPLRENGWLKGFFL